jgi:site-specific recombinase XerC
MPTASKPTRRRSGRGPVTKPGYHAGRVPPNKGRRVPTPVLTREEVGALFDAFHTARAVDARDKALTWLAYRHGLKCVQLVGIDTSGYDPARREPQ